MENDIIEKWIKGIPYELAFWNNVYRWKRTYEGLINWSHYGSVIKLEGFDANKYLIKQEEPIVLDVGCGMSYATGNFIKKADKEIPLDIHYVDPLARYFNNILKKYHRALPEIEFGMMEYLSAFYPKGKVSLVIIQNALDHSSNPVKGIIEALRILPVGGILYLNHHPNEAETEHYKGFHQFNITNDGDKLVIWNKLSRYIINDILGSSAEIKVSQYENGHVIAIITKKADKPELYDDMSSKKELATSISDIVANQFHLSRMLSFKLSYLKFNFIQFCVQAMSWKMKMGLKKLIHQA